jgi:hypothetical protein
MIRYDVTIQDNGDAKLERIQSHPTSRWEHGMAIEVSAEHRQAVAAKLFGPVDEVMVERAAKAAYLAQRSRDDPHFNVDWSRIGGPHREGWIAIARAALSSLVDPPT